MTTTDDYRGTAHELAARFKIRYWPGACWSCGDQADEGLVLNHHLVYSHAAVYTCQRCGAYSFRSKSVVTRLIEGLK